MNKLNQKLANWFKQCSPRTQQIIVNTLITAIVTLAFISTLSAEQHIIAP
jgi:hypothetical protein